MRAVLKIGEYSWIFPSFSWGIFSHVTCLDQSRASKKIWWIIRDDRYIFPSFSLFGHVTRYPDNSLPGQFAPDNSSPIFKQVARRSFIHYRAKRVAKYMNPRLNVIQIILRSFIHYRTNYSSFFYPLPSLGWIVQGASCPTFRTDALRAIARAKIFDGL